MLRERLAALRHHPLVEWTGRVLPHLRIPAITLGAAVAVLVFATACSSKSSGSNSPGTATPPTAASNAALESYVSNVCKSAAQFDADAASAIAGAGGSPAATPSTSPSANPSPGPSASPPASSPAGGPGGLRGTAEKLLVPAAQKLAIALSSANPPAEVKPYNDQLIGRIEQVITDIQNGTPIAAQRPQGTRPAGSASPAASPSASRTPRAGGPRGTGAGGFIFRVLPAPPAQIASELQQAAAANSDCQSVGFTFGG